jgi:hypothetical protein
MLKDPNLMFEPFASHATTESLVHPTVESDAHGRPRRIFHLTHEQRGSQFAGSGVLASAGSDV